MIAVPTEEAHASSNVASRFARAPFVLLFSDEGVFSESLVGEGGADSGAGGAMVRKLAERGVTDVLLPQVGPKAGAALAAAGMRAWGLFGDAWSAERAVRAFLAGELREMPL